jgi:hypothetical protein
MLWTVTTITFLAIVGVSVALLYAFAPSGVGIAGRLSRFLRPAEVVADKTGFVKKQVGKVSGTLASFGKHVPADSGKESSSRLLMMRAGYRRPTAVRVLYLSCFDGRNFGTSGNHFVAAAHACT